MDWNEAYVSQIDGFAGVNTDSQKHWLLDKDFQKLLFVNKDS